MSSGFVSGGTADAPIERDAEWLAAQQELEATRRKKADESRQSDGRGLFETLQANKAAKQDAFEEAARLKNQFRALDADEVEFLDSVLEKTREEEEQIKVQTREGLEVFRRRQEEADKKARELESTEVAEGEKVEDEGLFKRGKRKRGKEEKGLKGVKIRRESSNADSRKVEDAETEADGGTVVAGQETKAPDKSTLNQAKNPAILEAKSKKGLMLVDYGSDDDDY